MPVLPEEERIVTYTTPKVMAATNFHPVQPIVEAVETVGTKNPWSKTRTKRPGAENYNKIYKKLTTNRKHLPKTQGKSKQ